jgi:hypothetical protein
MIQNKDNSQYKELSCSSKLITYPIAVISFFIIYLILPPHNAQPSFLNMITLKHGTSTRTPTTMQTTISPTTSTNDVPCHNTRNGLHLRVEAGFLIPANETLTEPWKLADALQQCRKSVVVLTKQFDVLTTKLEETITQSNNASTTTIVKHEQQSTIIHWPITASQCIKPWQSISTTNPSLIELSVCYYTPEHLSGVFRIRKLTGCAHPTVRDWTDDEYYRELVDSTYGPEEFGLTLEGPELASSVPKHYGNCMYEMKFRLSIPGRYRISLVWVRTNYAASRDNGQGHPLGDFTFMTNDNSFIDLGGNGMLSKTLLELDEIRIQKLLSINKPTCDSSHDLALKEGRWIAVNRVKFERYNFVFDVEKHRMIDPNNYWWVPWDCRLPTLIELGNCFKTTQLIVMGDSHGEKTFQGGAHEFCRPDAQKLLLHVNDSLVFTTQIPNNNTNSSIVEFTSTKLDAIRKSPITLLNPTEEYEIRARDHFSLLDITLCRDQSVQQRLAFFRAENHNVVLQRIQEFSQQTDTLIMFNYGHHYMQQPSQLRSQLISPLDSHLSAISDFPAERRKRILAYTVSTMGYSDNPWMRGYRDGRTIPRLHAWSFIMNDKLTDAGVFVIPLFRMVLPMWNANEDSAHFPPHIYQHMIRIVGARQCIV